MQGAYAWEKDCSSCDRPRRNRRYFAESRPFLGRARPWTEPIETALYGDLISKNPPSASTIGTKDKPIQRTRYGDQERRLCAPPPRKI